MYDCSLQEERSTLNTTASELRTLNDNLEYHDSPEFQNWTDWGFTMDETVK